MPKSFDFIQIFRQIFRERNTACVLEKVTGSCVEDERWGMWVGGRISIWPGTEVMEVRRWIQETSCTQPRGSSSVF